MNTFVQVSGGRTSGMMAYLLRNKENHVFMFQNTGREKPETYDFLDRMDREWGLNLIWLEYSCPNLKKPASVRQVDYKTANRDGLPFSELIQKRQAIPNKFKRFCSPELKVKTARRWIRSQGHKKWQYAIGYRADEPKRQVRSDAMQTAITPLRELGVTSKDVADFWNNQPFDLDLPLLPNGKTFGGNCEGCFWHSEYQNAVLCRDKPESVRWLIEQETLIGRTFNNDYSYEQLLRLVSSDSFERFKQEDFFCTAVNGSCGV